MNTERQMMATKAQNPLGHEDLLARFRLVCHKDLDLVVKGASPPYVIVCSHYQLQETARVDCILNQLMGHLDRILFVQTGIPLTSFGTSRPILFKHYEIEMQASPSHLVLEQTSKQVAKVQILDAIQDSRPMRQDVASLCAQHECIGHNMDMSESSEVKLGMPVLSCMMDRQVSRNSFISITIPKNFKLGNGGDGEQEQME
jgi:hypothetical protein